MPGRISFETDLDKCVNTLAATAAGCRWNIEKKRCNAGDCTQCKVNLMYEAAVSNMAAVDRLRIMNMAGVKYAAMVSQSKHRLDYSKVSKPVHIFIYLCKVVGIALLLLFVAQVMHADTAWPEDRTGEALRALDETAVYVRDLNGDGKVNCVDYAVTYKVMWDRRHEWRYEKDKCEIVRNNNISDGFYHLFIRIWWDYRWHYIEPQGTKELYKMEEFWGRRYVPLYDITGETWIWMKKCGYEGGRLE